MSAAEVMPTVESPREAIMSRATGGITMLYSAAEALQRMREVQAFVREVMIEGVDYGVVPGTEKKPTLDSSGQPIPGTGSKPSLLQPGAQKLAELYGLAHRFELVEVVKDWTGGFFYFEVRCVLSLRRDTSFVGEGLGSCNSKESRYGQRWVTLKNVPDGMDPKTLRTKDCKSKFDNGGTYTAYLVSNDDPYSLVNTILKQACKRAYVHAVVSVTRSSGIFTQDVEDLPADAFGVVDEGRPWERGRAEPTVGDRDVKPSNVTVVTTGPAPAAAAAPPPPPAPAAPTTSADLVAKMTEEKEKRLVHEIDPLFAAARTEEAIRKAAATSVMASRAVFGANKTPKLFQEWHFLRQREQRAILGLGGPSVAKAPGASAAGAQAGGAR